MTERPHLTVYNEISLDGRITGFAGDGVRYYTRGFRWPSDAILMGSVTAEAFGPAESAVEQERELPPLPPVDLPPGFAELVREPRPLLVVPDSRGRLRCWRHAQAQPWYTDRVDLVDALARLAAELGIGAVRTDAGGELNGALLAAGLVDRIAVIVAPAIGADPEAQTLIRLARPLSDGVALRLVESEVLEDGALSLVYEVAAGIRPAPPRLLQT